LVVSAWTHIQDRLGGLAQKVRRPIFALWMAMGSVASMALSVELLPGGYIDLRYSLVALAAFFGGWRAMAITGGLHCSFGSGWVAQVLLPACFPSWSLGGLA
jgi:hypothetical protein